MSTFFGGQQLIRKLEFSSNTPSGSIYTVPSGRYAEVRILQAGSAITSVVISFGTKYSMTFATNTYVVGGVISGATQISGSAAVSTVPVYMSEGDTLGVNDGAYTFHVFEYQLP